MSAETQAEYQQSGILTHQGALYPIPDSQIRSSTPASEFDGDSIPLPESALEGIVPGSLKIVPDSASPVSR